MLPLQARKDAASTRIEYRLNRAITVDGTTLGGSGELLLESEKTLSLPGLGELVIKPGETDLSALSAQLRELEREHAQVLRELGVASLAEANRHHEKWQQLTAEKSTHVRVLELHAPKGIEALRDELVDARACLAVTDERRAKLPDVSNALPLADAKSAFDTARLQHENARTAQAGASEKKASALAAEQAVRERLHANQARLADPAFVRGREERQSQLVEKDALLKGYARELDACGKKLEAAQLDDPAAEGATRDRRTSCVRNRPSGRTASRSCAAVSKRAAAKASAKSSRWPMYRWSRSSVAGASCVCARPRWICSKPCSSKSAIPALSHCARRSRNGSAII
ncbi:DNA double-strand break repair Rad50 ATPase [Candidatus Paraburkholderia calva]|nr:DNA double-strand break repair Rad50 ATPase [Candidatus Paraburkholderia calva]